MKKILASLTIVGMLSAISASAADSYLYWMVQDSPVEFTYANLMGGATKDSADYLGGAFANGVDVNYDGEGNFTDYGATKTGTSTMATPSIALPAGSDGWTYYIELYNAENALVGTADLPYSAAAVYTTGPEGIHGGANAALAANIQAAAVPEPTSGVLLLLGMCGLALKRKRA